MMNEIRVCPSKLSGEIQIPPSKSLLHRYIIAASLAKGESEISHMILSQDVIATLNAIRALQIPFDFKEDCIIIKGGVNFADSIEFDANESGSTLRFLIPLLSAFSKRCIIKGSKRLFSRRLDPYFEIFKQQNIIYHQDADQLSVAGKLQPGDYHLRGDLSSQFVTGLLFALPLLDGDSTITVTTPLESKNYVKLTLQVLKNFGIEITQDHLLHYKIRGNQSYRPYNAEVEGDFSQAAFFLVADALGGQIRLRGLNRDSLQGDKKILEILGQCGAKVEFNSNTVSCKSGKLHAVSIDGSQIPDLVPILTVLLSFCEGESSITQVKRLRLKESDRLHAIATELNKLGGRIQEYDDKLVIQSIHRLNGASVSAHNDHRIAMALAVASTMAGGDVIIDDKNCVKKSMPQFFDEFKRLGGQIYE